MSAPLVLELFWEFFFIGTTTLGGGYAIVPQVLKMVHRRKWCSAEDLHQLLGLAQLAPGPVGINLPVLVGQKVGGLPGALAAFWGIVLPPLVLIVALTLWIESVIHLEVVRQVLTAVRLAVGGVILTAGVELFARPPLQAWEVVVLLLMGFSLWVLQLSVFVVLVFGLLLGVVGVRLFPRKP